MASVALWAACAGPDFMSAPPNDGGTTGEAGGDVAEEIVVIPCPGCWDMPDAMTDAATEDGDGAADGGGDTEASAAFAPEGGDSSNGPALSLLAGGLGGPGNVDGVGAEARFFGPSAVAADLSGNLYVGDGYAIRKMVVATNSVTTLAGIQGTAGTADGVGSMARFNTLSGLVADNSGNLFAVDRFNQTIRKIVLGTGAVTTFAGSAGTSGSNDAAGGNARFNSPSGIALDGAGNLYVGDLANSTIRKIVTSTREVTTLAGSPGATGNVDGTGSVARFNNPRGVATDGSGNLYVADSYNFTIRQIGRPNSLSRLGLPATTLATSM